jgi:2-keto-4-pentenoate hydratase/2-oxohepta-3-ene-1,7-dioic acid hydratase in catechol pathway
MRRGLLGEKMKHWARFRRADRRVGFGLVRGENIAEYSGDLFGECRPTGETVPISQCTLLAPCMPSKIIGLWNNFHALAAKIGKAEPGHPLYFIKAATALAGPDDTVRRPRNYAGKIVYEGELGIVIGRPCKEITAEQAPDYIFGYTCINDVTAIDHLKETPDFEQWTRAKSYDTFGVVGPVIATDIDVSGLSVITRLDGVERQNYPVADMIFSPPQIVSRISQDMSLLAGDVIACGTSLGVGSMKQGAVVEVTVAGIGTLRNVVGGFEPGN